MKSCLNKGKWASLRIAREVDGMPGPLGRNVSFPSGLMESFQPSSGPMELMLGRFKKGFHKRSMWVYDMECLDD